MELAKRAFEMLFDPADLVPTIVTLLIGIMLLTADIASRNLTRL